MPRVTAEADNSSAIEAERITMGMQLDKANYINPLYTVPQFFSAPFL